jgi:hypothetical protein
VKVVVKASAELHVSKVVKVPNEKCHSESLLSEDGVRPWSPVKTLTWDRHCATAGESLACNLLNRRTRHDLGVD